MNLGYTYYVLKLIGIILYLGEGGKTSRGMVSLANSDPAVIKIMIQNFFSQSWGGLKE